MVRLTDLTGFDTLTVTIGHVTDLTKREADTAAWNALSEALVAEHTQRELADLLLGACALLARVGGQA